jgi:hypothetical protein
MSYIFPYAPFFKRHIRKADGSSILIHFTKQSNDSTEHIHRAFTSLYHENSNFRSLLDGSLGDEVGGLKITAISVTTQFLSNGEEEANPYIIFKLHYHKFVSEITYQAYFDVSTGDIYRVSYVIDIC